MCCGPWYRRLSPTGMILISDEIVAWKHNVDGSRAKCFHNPCWRREVLRQQEVEITMLLNGASDAGLAS